MQSRSVADTDRVPWCSLSNAVRLILSRSGCDVDVDDLHAALAHPWMVCAVPSEPDLARWPLYARDRHLVAAGRLFGLTIRPIHPPEAAKGLSQAEEFRQHFDASYRPLILRALEHDQPVLAWRGWPGRWDAAWGIIRKPCTSGVGFLGSIAVGGCSTPHADGPNKSGESDAVELVHPPTQVYVVERVQATKPEPPVLLGRVIEHTRDVLTDAVVDAFGVLTGAPAWDTWLERIRRVDNAASGSALGALANGHSLLAGCVVESHRCAERFLARQCATPSALPEGTHTAGHAERSAQVGSLPWDRRTVAGGDGRAGLAAPLDAWRRACQVIVTYLTASTDEAFVREAVATSQGRRTLQDQIETAHDAAQAMSRVLRSVDTQPTSAR